MNVPPPTMKESHQPKGKSIGELDAGERLTGEEMDERRKEQIAYEYLCHLEEARLWLEACLKEELPAVTELEESLRNGVILGKLGNFFAPKTVPLRKVYDKDLKRYEEKGLHFKHTDNINYLLRAMEKIGLPKVFYPEIVDIYDMKNMPRAIYCIHALSLYLFKLGLAPQIQDLYGKATFTQEEINAMKQALDKYGIQMPAFGKIGGILAGEMSENEAAVHAAIVAINEAIDKRDSDELMKALDNPTARLINVQDSNRDGYRDTLYDAKKAKEAASDAKGRPEEELDMYDKLLTQAEIQGHINTVNLEAAILSINAAIDKGNEELLLQALCVKDAGLYGVYPANKSWYLQNLKDAKHAKAEKDNNPEALLSQQEIQGSLDNANSLADRVRQMETCVKTINKALDDGDADELMSWLQKPEALLPNVDPSRPHLYLDNLLKAKIEKGQDLDHDDLTTHLKILTAVAAINNAIDLGNDISLSKALENPDAQLSGADESLGSRYLTHFIAVKKEKREGHYARKECQYQLRVHNATDAPKEVGVQHEDLNQVEIQALIEYVNTEVQEENDQPIMYAVGI